MLRGSAAMNPTTVPPPVNGHARPVTLTAYPQQDAAARGPDEFRIAAGLASWSPAVLRAGGLLREETPSARPRAAARWRRQDEPAQPRTPADDFGHRRRVDGDTTIRVLAAAVVLAVAAFAAIVSYSHIFELGRHHGQDGTAARLLPLSVDGLIASASLVMLHAARRDLDVPWLARVMLALGVGATVAANVGYGLPFGWLSAVVSAWPAVAFVGSVEMAVRFVRDARHDGAAEPDSGPDTPAPDSGQPGHLTRSSVPPRADRTADKTAAHKTAPSRTGRARAVVRAARHDMSDDEPGAAGQPGEDGDDGTGLAGSHRVTVAAVAAPPVTPAVTPARGDRPPPGKVLTRQERAAVIRDHPGLTNAELAALCGCDARTIQRDKNSRGA